MKWLPPAVQEKIRDYRQERVYKPSAASSRPYRGSMQRGSRGARDLGLPARAPGRLTIFRGIKQADKRRPIGDTFAIVSATKSPPWERRRKNRHRNKVARASRKVNRHG